MPLSSATPVAFPSVPSPAGGPALRRRALRTALRAGHCAPTVMKTLVDAAGAAGAAWLVRLATGLPGVGNSGNECGALTAPLVLLGLRHARDPDEDGVPVVVSKGRALLQDFRACHGSCACRDLRLFGRLPLRCIGLVQRAPERFVDIDARPCAGLLSPEERRACARLNAHLLERNFHCAHAVLEQVRGVDAPEAALLDATSAFVGGTAHAGLTCSALTAGVMLLGLAHGAAEHSPGRVVRGMAGMAFGGRAFADDVAAVNGPMNEGHELATWFARQLGSTACRDLTAADLSTEAGVRRYVETDGVSRCREIAGAVAARVRGMIEGPRAAQ